MLGNAHALVDTQYALEPSTARVFARCTGAGEAVTLKLTVDGGAEEFTVGDVATGATSNAFGTIYAIQSSSGVWDGITTTGTCILVLTDVTGTFQNNEQVTGATSGDALADGTGSAGVLYYDPTNVKGKGVVGITSHTIIDGTAGKLVMTLEHPWAGLLSFSECIITAATADDWEVTIVSETVASTKLITLQVFKGGTATHPTTDEVLLFELVLSPYPSVPAGY